MNIGFTGTQDGMTDRQKENFKFNLVQYYVQGYTRFHHGDCIGADAQACDIAKEIGFKIICHPPRASNKRAWKEYDEIWPVKDYLVRNHDIVDCCNVLIATPKSEHEELRSGTWATVRYARKMKKELLLVFP